MTRIIHGVQISGLEVDPETRCAHYHHPSDIIAVKFKCCGRWFPCHLCHAQIEEHPPAVWGDDEFDELAVLCGGCGHRMSARDYLRSKTACPSCGRSFNPGCARHAHYYFALA